MEKSNLRNVFGTGRCENLHILTPTSLGDLRLGRCETYKGVSKRWASIALACNAAESGHFSWESLGVLNSAERATLILGNQRLCFERDGYAGKWMWEGEEVARTTCGYARRWLYWGGSRIHTHDGCVLMRMPLLGPSMRQVFDCYCVGRIQNGSRIRMCLARRHGKEKHIFDSSDLQALEAISVTTRFVLIGEFLRIRSLYVDY